MTELDEMVAAALLHLRRSVGTSAGIYLAKMHREFDRLRREKGIEQPNSVYAASALRLRLQDGHTQGRA